VNAPARDPLEDDPNLIQSAYNELADLPYTNTLRWVHNHRTYTWDSEKGCWKAQQRSKSPRRK